MTTRLFGVVSAAADAKKTVPAQGAGVPAAGAYELSEEDKAYVKGPYLARPAGCLSHERLMELVRRTRQSTWRERFHIARCAFCAMPFSGTK